MTWLVRRVSPEEGLRLRALRLRALADTPAAFGSTLAREEAFADAVWHERATQGALGEISVTYVAGEGDRWVGMVTGLLDEADEPRPALVGSSSRPRGGGGLARRWSRPWPGGRGTAAPRACTSA
jgi:hypothetical protein